MNIVSEASRTNKTVEIVNQVNFEIENDKLQKMYLKKKEKCKSLKNEIAEMKQLMNNLNNKVDSLKLDNQNLLQINQEINNKADDLKYDNLILNQKIDEHKNALTVVAAQVTRISENTFNNQMESQKFIKKNFPENYISTKSTNEVFILINRPSLTDEINNDYEELSINDVVLDSISCQIRDRNQNLIKHGFNEKEDEIIFESYHGK